MNNNDIVLAIRNRYEAALVITGGIIDGQAYDIGMMLAVVMEAAGYTANERIALFADCQLLYRTQ